MREIKFKGKRIDNGEWVYGCYVRYERMGNVKHIIVTDLAQVDVNSYYVIPETVGQYTGLRDKNGIEIYEGDIVRVMDSTLAMVKYSDDRGAYYLDCEKKIGDVGLICQYDTIKRVGNVYENPELLESEGN